MASPSKRSLTDEQHDGIIVSRLLQNSLLSDDLSTRLQNIGARVRKSVSDGYSSDKCASVPSTPHPSPAKIPSTSSPMNIFKSANDTFNEIFSSVTRENPSVSSPSPRKRRLADLDDDLVLTPDADVDMALDESIGDDDVLFDLGVDIDRPIKPLRKIVNSKNITLIYSSAPSSLHDTFYPSHQSMTLLQPQII